MAMKCELCGKGPQYGNVVSHANNTRRRRWNPNLKRVRAVVSGVHKTDSRVHGMHPSGPCDQSSLSEPLNLSPSSSSRALRLRRAAALLPVAGLVFSVLAGCKQSEHHAADVWATVNGTEIKRDEIENTTVRR